MMKMRHVILVLFISGVTLKGWAKALPFKDSIYMGIMPNTKSISLLTEVRATFPDPHTLRLEYVEDAELVYEDITLKDYVSGSRLYRIQGFKSYRPSDAGYPLILFKKPSVVKKVLNTLGASFEERPDVVIYIGDSDDMISPIRLYSQKQVKAGLLEKQIEFIKSRMIHKDPVPRVNPVLQKTTASDVSCSNLTR